MMREKLEIWLGTGHWAQPDKNERNLFTFGGCQDSGDTIRALMHQTIKSGFPNMKLNHSIAYKIS